MNLSFMKKACKHAGRRSRSCSGSIWRETTLQPRNLKIFREELDDFLPETILDFHIHVMNRGVAPRGLTWSSAGHPIRKYDFDDLKRDLAESYPGRKTMGVCFGIPESRFDRAANDRYVARHCDFKRFFPLRLFDPNEKDPEAVRQDIVEQRFLGLKPYLNYVRHKAVNDIEIRDMLPPWIMEIADDLGLIIVLHIPRRERLADPLNQKQIVEWCRRYPRTKIVLAHIGRAYYLKGVVGHLERLKSLPNLWYDLAMLNHWEVLQHLFETVDSEKILYGTDIPLAVAPGKSIEINDQYTYVTPVPWELSISDDHHKIVFTSFLYEELRAIRKAVEQSRLGGGFVRRLFCENGHRLLQSVMR
jgi:predicted TIM-barrel fold metal-dependent hydrolase